MRLRWQIKTLLDRDHAQDINDIYSRFGIAVSVRTKLHAQALSDLYDALEVMSDYYGIAPKSMGLNGISIIIEKRVYDGRTFFKEGDVVDGLFDSKTRSIHLTAKRPNALAHEFVHAVDYAFRSGERQRWTSYTETDGKRDIHRSLNGFASFLAESDVPERDVKDFVETYKIMQEEKDAEGYLTLPSEIVARMGEFSFWNDNKEACAGNPFLNFSYEPFHEAEDVLVERFPFHSVNAIRYFVHHAAREIAKEPPERWHPVPRSEFAPEHGTQWYREKWYKLYEARHNVQERLDTIEGQAWAIKNDAFLDEEKRRDKEKMIRDAKEELPGLKKTLAQTAISLMRKIENPDLNARLSMLKPASSRIDGIIFYMRECQTAARLREQELQAGGKKRKERER